MRMTAIAAFAALGGLFAMEAAAQTTDEETREKVLAAVRENGCRMTNDQAGEILPSLGLERDQVRRVVRAMRESGEVQVERGVLVLADQTGCPEQADARATLIAAFEANGCEMTEDQARNAFRMAGVDTSEVDDAAEALLETGQIVITEDRDVARLIVGDVCGGGAEASETPQSKARAFLIEALEARSCIISEEDAEELLETSGLDPDVVENVAEAMVDSGEILFNERTDMATLVIGDTCAGAAPPDPRAVIIAAMEENGCSMTNDEAEAFMENSPIPENVLDDAADDMIDAGEISVDRGVGVAKLLIGERCGPAVAVVEETEAQSARGVIIAAFEANGCVLNREQTETILSEAGLPEDDLEEAADAMLDAGEVIFDRDAGLARLTIGDQCAAASDEATPESPAVAAREALIAAFEANNCAMTQRDAAAALEAQGIERSAMNQAAEAMLDAGEIVPDSENRRLARLVGVGACASVEVEPPVNEPVTPEVVATASDDPRTILTAVLEKNRCFLDGDDIEETLEPLGFDEDSFLATMNQMVESGDVEIGEEGLILKTGSVCGAPAVVEEPQAEPETPRDILIQRLRDNGCVLPGDALEDLIEDELGLDENIGSNLLATLMSEGEIGLDFSGSGSDPEIVLRGGEDCAAVAAERTLGLPRSEDYALGRAVAIKALEAGDCRLSEDDLRQAIRSSNARHMEIHEIAVPMVEDGEIAVDPDTGDVILTTGENCQ